MTKRYMTHEEAGCSTMDVNYDDDERAAFSQFIDTLSVFVFDDK